MARRQEALLERYRVLLASVSDDRLDRQRQRLMAQGSAFDFNLVDQLLDAIDDEMNRRQGWGHAGPWDERLRMG